MRVVASSFVFILIVLCCGVFHNNNRPGRGQLRRAPGRPDAAAGGGARGVALHVLAEGGHRAAAEAEVRCDTMEEGAKEGKECLLQGRGELWRGPSWVAGVNALVAAARVSAHLPSLHLVGWRRIGPCRSSSRPFVGPAPSARAPWPQGGSEECAFGVLRSAMPGATSHRLGAWRLHGRMHRHVSRMLFRPLPTEERTRRRGVARGPSPRSSWRRRRRRNGAVLREGGEGGREMVGHKQCALPAVRLAPSQV